LLTCEPERPVRVARHGRVRDLSPPRCAVVEDEALVRFLAVDIFEEAGFEVIEASNGEEGLRMLEGRPDVRALVTDVDMPGRIDAFHLARLTHERHPAIAVLVVSGRRRPEEADLPPGAKFMGKPYPNSAWSAPSTN
jgi:CheY-like chemotaxis protein